jgi:hypothetical protein
VQTKAILTLDRLHPKICNPSHHKICNPSHHKIFNPAKGSGIFNPSQRHRTGSSTPAAKGSAPAL